MRADAGGHTRIRIYRVVTIREQLLAKVKVAPPGSNWFVRLVWALIDVNEPGLVGLDEEIAQIIWNDNSGHTISWHLGQEEAAGNELATEICDVLSEFLGADHCKNAFDNGN